MITTITYPVANAKLTSPFGPRTSPTTGKRVLHEGQDLAVPAGTPIVAVAPGVVRVSRRDAASGCRGEYIVIDHGAGWDTRYFHLSRRDVSEGDAVHAGQPIGLTGRTGCVTGPHLHFEVWRDDVPQDPKLFFVGAVADDDADDDDADDDAPEKRPLLRVHVAVDVPPAAIRATEAVADGMRTLGYVAGFLGATIIGATAVNLLK